LYSSRDISEKNDGGTFAMQLLEIVYGIRTMQELLGHEDVLTTQIYTHVLNRDGQSVISPIDRNRKLI